MEQFITETDQAVVKNDRLTAVSTVGYGFTAILLWMIGLLLTGWSFGAGAAFETGLLYGLGGFMLTLTGILTLLYGRSLDTIIFLGLSGLLLSIALGYVFRAARPGYHALGGGPEDGYLGWFALCWAVFFCYLWIASFRAGILRILFLVFLWLAIGVQALGAWTGGLGWHMLGGYLLLASGVCAFILSAAEVISFGPGKGFRKKMVLRDHVVAEERPSGTAG